MTPVDIALGVASGVGWAVVITGGGLGRFIAALAFCWYAWLVVQMTIFAVMHAR